ncbi:hypothetical protein GCM10022214_51410 [Actinomadura miaoliensis]|uniref:Uncharacterized protein n=1 Tax=Actinomadura miaoliensis TaxID=430685 RepID=A0ABP7WB20_9ACTN
MTLADTIALAAAPLVAAGGVLAAVETLGRSPARWRVACGLLALGSWPQCAAGVLGRLPGLAAFWALCGGVGLWLWWKGRLRGCRRGKASGLGIQGRVLAGTSTDRTPVPCHRSRDGGRA